MRRRFYVWGAILAGLTGLLVWSYPVVGDLTGLYCVPRKLYSVAAPQVNAEPAEVVRVYIRAVMARDLATTRLLSTPEFAEREESVGDSVFCSWSNMTELTVLPPYPDRDAAGRTVVYAPVKMALRHGGNGPEETGELSWGYWLEKDGVTGRWRIYGSGEG